MLPKNPTIPEFLYFRHQNHLIYLHSVLDIVFFGMLHQYLNKLNVKIFLFDQLMKIFLLAETFLLDEKFPWLKQMLFYKLINF